MVKTKNFLCLINNRIVGVKVIDLSGDEGRFLQLKDIGFVDEMGFLPNGDLNIAYHYSNKIYKYSFVNKPTNATLWEHSQLYKIETHKSLINFYIHKFVYQTKLFIFNNGFMSQWDLLTMTLEMQYNLVYFEVYSYRSIVINKNQTLLALCNHKQTDIYSMETGIHVSRYG